MPRLRDLRMRDVSLLVGAVLSMPAFSAASVILQFTDHDATPTSANVAPGGSFVVSLQLSSSSNASSDQATAVDYELQGSTSGVFTILTRNSQTVSSAFPDVYATPDSTVSNTALTPRESTNLGGSESNVNSPISNGTYEVADYMIGVKSGTPAGVYTLTAYAPSAQGLGYEGPGPNFNSTSFSSIGTFTVTVPEPGGISIGILTTAGLASRRRTSSRKRRAAAQGLT